MVRTKVRMMKNGQNKLVYTGVHIGDLKKIIEYLEDIEVTKGFFVQVEVPIEVGKKENRSSEEDGKPFGACTEDEKCDTFERASTEENGPDDE